MTRRERREAERLAADAAYDAQHASGSDDGENTGGAALAGAPNHTGSLFPSSSGSSPVPPRPDAAASAQPAPEQPAPEQSAPAQSAPGPSTEAGSDQSSLLPPVTDAGSGIPPVPSAPPSAPSAPSSPTAGQPSSPAAEQDVPLFTSRSERKRFLREHGLPADISTAAIPVVLAQRDADGGEIRTGPDEAPTNDAPAGDALTEDASAGAPSGDEAVGDEAADWTGTSATDEPAGQVESGPSAVPDVSGWDALSEPSSGGSGFQQVFSTSESTGAVHAASPVTTGATDGAWGQDPVATPDIGGGTHDQAATHDQTAAHDQGGAHDQAEAADGSPSYDLASRRVDAYPTGPDFETSSTAVITPSALGDFDAPLRRRSPVVKPPTGANIRVVTGALPIVTPEDLAENPPTTPLSAIDDSALSSGALGTGTFSTGPHAAGPSTSPAPATDPWTHAGLADEEEEDSDELDEPPAKPMSARSVTHEDGTILVAERNSMVPYIVLGAAGFVALALVVIALLLLL